MVTCDEYGGLVDNVFDEISSSDRLPSTNIFQTPSEHGHHIVRGVSMFFLVCANHVKRKCPPNQPLDCSSCSRCSLRHA